MEDHEQKQLETADIGLLVFGIVTGWLVVFYSGLF
jgi:hypothetical protein